MTPDQVAAIRSIYGYLTRESAPLETVLEAFGTDDGVGLGARLLREAIEHRDGDEAEDAFTVCGAFGFSEQHVRALIEMFPGDWHRRHEDVVSGLVETGTSDAVGTLWYATQWVPEYLEFDDARALARKAVWGLGALPGDHVTAMLRELAAHPHPTISADAQIQLDRRDGS